MSINLTEKANKLFRDERKTKMWLAEKNPFFDDQKPQEYMDANPDKKDFVLLEMHMATLQEKYAPEKETQKQRKKRITGLANHFFEDKKRAKKWLNSESIPFMGYKKPLEHLKTEEGTKRVEQAFANMIYGFCA